ncbi:amidohydrolase [Pseudoroseomonas wenyumeiae]|uniref:Amidohydrolase n=1 Tax=Teichococcus wenyumeiae TaxID=2478470 RepID=A0A3A9J6T2_9PROT|nr:M20 family metallopeptidase [Pseudoroseomonas wenyumeiae]RKK01371.1 amidohydrolase [Pseudoroseomonas wenyumeiae]RMI14678.1 amidohydrolase [Pseudoroseomonas wenyumeiae]
MRNEPIALSTLSASVDSKSPAFTAVADRIWEHAELRFEEHRSIEEQIALLEAEGFRVTRNLGGIPTAFVAESGSGGPVLGFLGEFDALAGLSQEAGVTEPRPVKPGATGHGCGHNLLGAGAMLAAVAARDALAEQGLPGTVRYYGCPGEEGGSGKTFMARAGVFNDIDAAVSWHPGVVSAVNSSRSMANFQVCFRFKGRASHAAGSPWLGRSALDAVEIMNVGVNYLREHMPLDCRVHYAITNSGGNSPNVVQADAEVLYLIRGPRVKEAKALFERVKACAEGAAIMTGTRMEMEIDKACSDTIPNTALEMRMFENLSNLGAPAFDEADRAFAAEIRRSLSEEDIADSINAVGAPEEVGAQPLHEGVLHFDGNSRPGTGSTDVGDVSQIVPTVQCWGPTWAVGTPFHTWQAVAQGKSPSAHKGMILAAKGMAATALDIFQDAELLARAKAELKQRTGGKPYACPIPDDVLPPPLRKRR